MMNKCIAEAIGTFGLVFAGTGAIIINDVSGGTITHVGIAITFGLVVMTMIYAFGDTSGAHINPAVTLAFWFAGRFSSREVAPYVIAQMLGAFAASGLLRLLFPASGFPNSDETGLGALTLGATLPAGPVWQSFVLETVLTFMLMMVILAVATGPKEKGLMAGIAVGGVVGFEAMFAGPVSGASMNPARSLAPAVLSGDVAQTWVYLAAPVLGALLAVPAWRMTRPLPTTEH